MNQIETLSIHQIINPYVQIWEIWRHSLLCWTQIENLGLGCFNLLGKETKSIDFKVCTTHPLVRTATSTWLHCPKLNFSLLFMFYWPVAWIEHGLITDLNGDLNGSSLLILRLPDTWTLAPLWQCSVISFCMTWLTIMICLRPSPDLLVLCPLVDFKKYFQPERDMEKLCIFVYACFIHISENLK